MADEEEDVSAIGAVGITEVTGVTDADAAGTFFTKAKADAELGGEVAVGESVVEKVAPGSAGIDEEIPPGPADLQAVLEDELVETGVEIVAIDADVGAVEITGFVGERERETTEIVIDGTVGLGAEDNTTGGKVGGTNGTGVGGGSELP